VCRAEIGTYSGLVTLSRARSPSRYALGAQTFSGCPEQAISNNFSRGYGIGGEDANTEI